MSEPLADVWRHRDLPVLREAARRADEGGSSSLSALVEATGLARDEVERAARSLRRQGLVELDTRSGGIVAGIASVSGQAYERTGLYPNADPVDRLVEALLKAAEESTDPEEKSWLRTTAKGAGGVGRDVLTRVLGELAVAGSRGMFG